MAHDFRVVNGVPAGKLIAPYVALLAAEAKCGPTSLYRGQDAESILRAHGHSSQRQLYDGFVNHRPGFLPANPPGFSTHELRSDGVAYPNVPRGGRLAWWQEGMDFDDSCVDRVIAAGKRHGWDLFRPYPSGSEHHHLNMRHEPKPKNLRARLQLRRLRMTLPADEMEHPEWAGYLAAFDAYIDACKTGDREHQEQARLLMGWFAGELLDDDAGLSRRHVSYRDIEAMMRLLRLDK